MPRCSRRGCRWRARGRRCGSVARGRSAIGHCSGPCRARRSETVRAARKEARAPAMSPCARSKSPILLWPMERSRCQRAFPGSCVARRSANGEGRTIGGKRACPVALIAQHIANIVVAHRKVALPVGIAGILLCQALADGEAGAFDKDVRAPVPSPCISQPHYTDLLMANGEVAVPLSVSGVLRDQALGDREGRTVGGKRAGKVALCTQHVADHYVAYVQLPCQPVLPGSCPTRRSSIATDAR